MKKKSDKVIILLIAILIFMVMSWIVEGGAYSSGQFASTGVSQIGLFDVFLAIYSAFFRMLPDILYILVVGGCYEVLSQTKGYQKMVDKVSNFIKGKESIALAVITLLMGLYTSITSHILVLICVAPFIVSVFLRNGKDRLTALSAGFGGLFLGYLGLTFGTYGIAYINSAMGLNTSNWIVQKFVIFIVAYILYVLFAILHMRKCKKVNEVKYDHFYTEELDETKVKRKNKTKVWPTALICIIGVLVLALGYIDWTTSFNIKTFAEFHTSFTGGFKVADVPVFGTIIGSYMNAFGEWTDLLYGSFIIVLLTAI
ncbi:MAG: hypothetical protein K2H20_01405, partial [Bacilli bacterium]|nr:hypothetical protein [Bacilli bacterium]